MRVIENRSEAPNTNRDYLSEMVGIDWQINLFTCWKSQLINSKKKPAGLGQAFLDDSFGWNYLLRKFSQFFLSFFSGSTSSRCSPESFSANSLIE